MPLHDSSIPAVLRERARQRPDAKAFTYIDYEVDPAGYAETLTWSEVHQRAQVIAAELASYGSPGDRVAICAPQGLEYILGFFGALEAGLVAVPLSVPVSGAHDERVTAILSDCRPVAVVTTSTVADGVAACTHGLPGSPPAVVQVDALDLYTPPAVYTEVPETETALLQYTSGSTRAPIGVVVTHKNVLANLEQVISDYFEDIGGTPPPDLTLLSWLPFYHDMGLLLGLTAPVGLGLHAVLTSPMAFLQKPARWLQMLAAHSQPFSAAPNFAFELAVRRTTDEDMAGLDLGKVHTILSGSERIHAATLQRFAERFAQFNLPASAPKPSYGLAEAMVYVASSNPGRAPVTVHFDYEKLAAGHAERSSGEGSSEFVSVGVPRACTVRIVDSEAQAEKPADEVGEIWVHGDNVAVGYWRNPQLTERTFGGRLLNPSPGTPQEPWLRTGDLGVMSDGELFIVGRIKDLLIVDGRNHYPDDIEATIQEISGGRAVAISVLDDDSEKLVTIVEVKSRGNSDEEILERLQSIKQKVSAAISRVHRLRVSDLVLVPPGSIPITTSGKVRRSACGERYRQHEFTRLDAPR